MAEADWNAEFTLAAAIRRYFDVCLFLLIFTGFGTLASTGRLDLPTVLLVSVALLIRGFGLARRRQLLLSERWTNLLTIGCVAFYIADEFLITRTFLGALVHLVLFVMLVRLFSAQKDRDHYLLAALSFVMVLAAAVLTVDSTFLLALAGFVLVGFATFILMEMMHASSKSPVQGRDPLVPRAYRKLSFIVVTIAPVLLLLTFIGATAIFFILPRVSVGYLSAYAGANQLSTGFSDRVELGKIGQIQQSKTVVMHVLVAGDTSGGTELKLRGIALNNFDGHAWTNTREKLVLKKGVDGRFDLLRSRIPPIGRDVHYQVTLEPVLNDVFFLLQTPVSLQGNYRAVAEDSASDVHDLDPERPIVRYEADSIVPVSSTQLLRRNEPDAVPAEIRRDYLQLPNIDPRVAELAQQIAARAASPYEKATQVEGYLRTHFGYTLQLPATEPKDPIANFLFVRKQGHCEYFASSMAVMLRTLGVPSRVVNGFSGGEFNDITSQYVIRASNAHSWVEAYIPGDGWVQFDPTPAGAGQVETSWSRFMLYMDALSSFWRDWIVNYDLGHQVQLTRSASRGSREIVGRAQTWMHGKYDAALDWARGAQDQVGKATVVWGERILVAFILILFALSIPKILAYARTLRLARRPERAPQTAASLWYERMLRQLAKHGWEKAPAQTPDEFVSTIPDQALKARVESFTESYEDARFGNSAEKAAQLPELYEEIKNSR